ncbi:MAG: hypothetical protein QME79_12035 [Bacillota bacterium]|nr:hypothetical protein [Bacillota bacterium]
MVTVALLVVYTIALGLLELQFHFTVGAVIVRLVHLLLGAG